MKTIEQKAMELCIKGGKLDYGRDRYDRGNWGGYNAIAYNSAKEMANFVILRAIHILRETDYFKNEEGISEAAMEEQFMKTMKGE